MIVKVMEYTNCNVPIGGKYQPLQKSYLSIFAGSYRFPDIHI